MKDRQCAVCPKSGCGGWKVVKQGKDSIGRDYREIRGIVETPQGKVEAYSFWLAKSTEHKTKTFQHCWVSIIINGVEHYRSWEIAYTWKGLITKAKEFAKTF